MRTKKLKPGMKAWSWDRNDNGDFYIFSCTLIQLTKEWNCSWQSWEYKTEDNKIDHQMDVLMYPSFATAKTALIKHLHDLIDLKRMAIRSELKELNANMKELDIYEDSLKDVEQLEEE